MARRPSCPGNLNCRLRMLSEVSVIRGSGHVWPGKLNRLLSHPASSAGCEISGEGGTSAGQNSGCEISGEGWTSTGQKFRMWDIRRRLNVGQTEIPDVRYPKKVERRPDRISDVRYLEKVERRLDRIPNVRYPEKVECRPDRILPRMEWAMSRVARGIVCVCKAERATWHFLGRIPQVGEGLERETGLVVWLNGCTHGYGRTWLWVAWRMGMGCVDMEA